VAAAEGEMSRVEDDADVGQLEQPLDLPRRLHERPRMVMETEREAPLLRELGGSRDPVCQPTPAALIQTQGAILGRLAGIGDPLRRAGVRKDRVGLTPAG